MNRRLGFGALAALTLVAGAACSEDDTGPAAAVNFAASLSGTAERPNPVTTTATGTSTVVINEAAQSFTVTVNITGTGVVNVTAAHIHVGDANTAGPVAVNILPTAPAAGTFTGTLTTGTFSTIAAASGETFATLVAKMRAGNTYINVHNVANAGGHIRGQLVAQ
jgi:CHRD domain-containing protein